MSPRSPRRARPDGAAASAPSTRASDTDIPALDIRGPRRSALLAAGGLIGLMVVAGLVVVPTSIATSARGRLHAEPVIVRHSEGGVVAKLFVREGDEIAVGAPVASFDTRLLDSQIAGLRRQIDGIKINIGGLKEEATGLAGSERTSPQRQRLAGLEGQIAAAEQEVLGLEVRLAMASEERGRTDVRAPAAGRVAKMLIAEAGSVPPGGGLATIQPASDRLSIEATFALDRSVPVHAGQTVFVRPDTATAWTGALIGAVEQVLSEDARGVRVRITAPLSPDRAKSADAQEQIFSLRLVTGAETLFDRFAAALHPSTTDQRQSRMTRGTP